MTNKEKQPISDIQAERTDLHKRRAAQSYVRRVLAQTQWSGKRLAEEIDVSASTINRFINESNDTYALTSGNLIKIREKTGVPLDPVVIRAYNLQAVVPDVVADEDEPSNVREAPDLRLDGARNEPDSIPIYGTARGGNEGTFELNEGQVIEWRSRPAQLKDKGDIFGLYVEGDSMSPRYDEGELILVFRKRPVIIGRDVVIQMKPRADGENPKAYLKRLVSKNSEFIVVESLNPPEPRTFKMSEVESLHLVLLRSEMI